MRDAGLVRGWFREKTPHPLSSVGHLLPKGEGCDRARGSAIPQCGTCRPLSGSPRNARLKGNPPEASLREIADGKEPPSAPGRRLGGKTELEGSTGGERAYTMRRPESQKVIPD
jgi:hypothetical protein